MKAYVSVLFGLQGCELVSSFSLRFLMAECCGSHLNINSCQSCLILTLVFVHVCFTDRKCTVIDVLGNNWYIDFNVLLFGSICQFC